MDELGEKVATGREFWGEGSAMCRSYIGSGEVLVPRREPGEENDPQHIFPSSGVPGLRLLLMDWS